MKEAYKGTLGLMLVLTLVSLFACGDDGSDAPVFTCYPSHIRYTYPEDNETDIEGYQVIYVRFTYPMDDSTINDSTFTLEDDTGNIVAGWVRFQEYNPNSFALPKAYAFFYPSGNLSPSTRYTATLDSSVQCEEGHTLGCNYSWEFTTKADDGIGFWEPVSNTGAPFESTAVFTGHVMIVWDGIGGGQFSVDTSSWQAISTIDAPSSGRSGHTAVWTGSEMIVWGGDTTITRNGEPFIIYRKRINTGGVYYPDTDSWEETSTTNTPLGMSGHSAIWTGGEMIVWNGTGGRYIP